MSTNLCNLDTSCCPTPISVSETPAPPPAETTAPTTTAAPRDGVEAAPAAVEFEPTTIVASARRGWQSAPSIADVASGARKLGRGHEGPAVTKVQRQLHSLGYELAQDGKLGPETQAAIFDLQKAHGLTGERGRVGPGTLAVLEARHAAIAKAGMDAVANPQVVLRTNIGPGTAPIARLPQPTQAAIRALTKDITTDADRGKLYALVSSEAFAKASPTVQASVLARVAEAPNKDRTLEAELSLVDLQAFSELNGSLGATRRYAET